MNWCGFGFLCGVNKAYAELSISAQKWKSFSRCPVKATAVYLCSLKVNTINLVVV